MINRMLPDKVVEWIVKSDLDTRSVRLLRFGLGPKKQQHDIETVRRDQNTHIRSQRSVGF